MSYSRLEREVTNLIQQLELSAKAYERAAKKLRKALMHLRALSTHRFKPEVEFKRLGKAVAALQEAQQILIDTIERPDELVAKIIQELDRVRWGHG